MDILEASYKKAKKQHSCDECYKKIVSGEIYHYAKMVDGGVFYHIRTCIGCKNLAAEMCQKQKINEWNFGDIEEFFLDERCPLCVYYRQDTCNRINLCDNFKLNGAATDEENAIRDRSTKPD